MDARARARLFVALMLGEKLGCRLASAVSGMLGASEADVRRNFRLPRPEGLHATLYFLGDRERSCIEELEAELGRTLEGRRAPRLRLGAGGTFARRGRPFVLWSAVTGSGLDPLWQATLEAVAAIGVDVGPERARGFRPHVTVARPRPRATIPAAFFDRDVALEWNPTEVAVVESVSGDRARPGPPVYRPVARVPLGTD